jgi:glutamate N-acetyltransferase/amino-acid N-acetyltransferase
MKKITGTITTPQGFIANGIHCGIRKNKNKLDLALIYSKVKATASAVYTTNLVKGAPIILNRMHLENGIAQAIICNSGIANTCNSDGLEKAIEMANIAGNGLKINPEDVLVGSTGVIGEPLNLEPVKNCINTLVNGLCIENGSLAAEAIMTTDTVKKEVVVEFKINDKKCLIAGIAKGSGMINPNMATMLSFITSDVSIEKSALDKALSDVVKSTYNMISVDGDTSTNDMVVVLANGMADNEKITLGSKGYKAFKKALELVAITLSKKIASDGEGASKLLICNVFSSPSVKVARTSAKAVIQSSLVKTAMFGADANWGRILCAVGYSGVFIDVNKVDITLKSKYGSIDVCKNGQRIVVDEDLAKKILLEKEITIDINLNQGRCKGTAYGCDLTYEYVRINGDYRS